VGAAAYEAKFQQQSSKLKRSAKDPLPNSVRRKTVGVCPLDILLNFELWGLSFGGASGYANNSLINRPLLTSCTGRPVVVCSVCAGSMPIFV